jgi:hypothetical protein
VLDSAFLASFNCAAMKVFETPVVVRETSRSSSGENGISQNLQVIGEGSVVFAISAVEKRDVV